MMWRERTIDPIADWRPNASGLYVPPKARRARPIAIDLFSGAGGFSLGIIQAGFEVVAACDNDPDATMTYLANHGTYPVQMVWIDLGDKERHDERCRSGDHRPVCPLPRRRRRGAARPARCISRSVGLLPAVQPALHLFGVRA